MIAAVVGRNGEGKTLAAVYLYVLKCWERGRPVVSNIRLYPERIGFKPDLYLPVESVYDLNRYGRHLTSDGDVRYYDEAVGELWSLTNNDGCMLLLDEITSVLPSRDFANVPPQLQKLTQQLRKPDIAPMVWTAPAFGRGDVLLREVVTEVVEARAVLRFLSKRAEGFGWPRHRFFRYGIYDGQDYEAAFSGQAIFATSGYENDDALRPRKVRWLWRPSKLAQAFAAYDTLEGVDLLDHIECASCGGKFSRRVCKCDRGSSGRGAP